MGTGDVEARFAGDARFSQMRTAPEALANVLSAVATAARERIGREDIRAVVAGSPELPTGVVRTMMQALTRAGFAELSFSIKSLDAGPCADEPRPGRFSAARQDRPRSLRAGTRSVQREGRALRERTLLNMHEVLLCHGNGTWVTH